MHSLRHSPALSVRNGRLFIEDCDCTELADQFGTPVFVVSETHLVDLFHSYRNAYEAAWPEGSVRVMVASKANPVTAIRRLLTREGAGCDTFGAGELELALRGGTPTKDIAVNGSIKQPEIIRKAIDLGAHIVLDNPRELEYTEQAARDLGKDAHVLLRVKPFMAGLDEPSDFFPSRSIREMTQTVKYGIPASELSGMLPLLRESSRIKVLGVHMHMGRHSKKLAVWDVLMRSYVDMIKSIADELGGGWSPEVVSLGGGMAAALDLESRVAVTDYDTPTVEQYAECMASAFRDQMRRRDLPTEGILLEVEPGRALHNETGIHLARVHNTKHETEHGMDYRWVETDTSECFLGLGSLNPDPKFDYVIANKADQRPAVKADIVGITCNYECLVEQAPLPQVVPGDVVAFLNTGSYIEVYACNFNALPRPGMVLVKGDSAEWVKRPEQLEDVFARDIVPERLHA